MACRNVEYNSKTNSFIKRVPFHESLKGISFPYYNEEDLKEKINHILNYYSINKYTQEAIIQQYNEILLYKNVDEDEKKLLAPQKYYLAEMNTNLPIIIYPNFIPFMRDEEVWAYKDYELHMIVGLRAEELGISKNDLLNFFLEVSKLCINYDLNENDLISNPSNIGYNSQYGLRLIDYGLRCDRGIFEF